MTDRSFEPGVNPRKTLSVRRLGPVDVAALRAAVLAIPERVWDIEDARKPNASAVRDTTRHIVLRFVDSPDDWRRSHDRPAWAGWRRLLKPVLAEAVRDYDYARGAFPLVMLARMPSRGAIQPHIDAAPAAKWPHRIHVPLTTNAAVTAVFGGQEHYFPPDRAVEVNNLAPHWVRNGGDTDRIHLVFDYYDVAQRQPARPRPSLLAEAAW